MKTKILTDFKICISVPLSKNQLEILQTMLGLPRKKQIKYLLINGQSFCYQSKEQSWLQIGKYF